MSRIAQLNLRVRPSLKAKLEKLAKQDRRTLSGYVEKQLEDHVTEQERRRAKRSTIIRTTAHSSP
jgi:predicted HicB family RNase H-like nuclease